MNVTCRVLLVTCLSEYLYFSQCVSYLLQEYRCQMHSKDSAQNPQSASHIFIRCLGALQHLFSGICHTAAAQLSALPDRMLPGHTLLAAAYLVSEPAAWLCLFLTHWQHLHLKKKTGAKSKGGTATNMPPLDDETELEVRQQLDRLNRAMEAALQVVLRAVNACLKVSTKVQIADALQLALSSTESEASGLVAMINECLHQPDLHSLLSAIVENQKLLLKRIKLQLSEQISAF